MLGYLIRYSWSVISNSHSSHLMSSSVDLPFAPFLLKVLRFIVLIQVIPEHSRLVFIPHRVKIPPVLTSLVGISNIIEELVKVIIIVREKSHSNSLSWKQWH